MEIIIDNIRYQIGQRLPSIIFYTNIRYNIHQLGVVDKNTGYMVRQWLKEVKEKSKSLIVNDVIQVKEK